MLDSTKKLMTFTFVTEKEGSTVIEQFKGADVEDATLRWLQGSQTHPGEPLEGDVPAPVETVENVWCTGGHDAQGTFFLVHIVATATG